MDIEDFLFENGISEAALIEQLTKSEIEAHLNQNNQKEQANQFSNTEKLESAAFSKSTNHELKHEKSLMNSGQSISSHFISIYA